MSEWHPVCIEDRETWARAMAEEDTRDSSCSFGSLFLWDHLCARNIAAAGNRLCSEYICAHRPPFYGYPIGGGSLEQALELMAARCSAGNRRLIMRCVSKEQCERLEAASPGHFKFTPDRSNADYIYSAEALASLSGKKLHGKRNHCNRFEQAHEWHTETLSPALWEDCRVVFSAWTAAQGGEDAEDEAVAIENAMRYWRTLDFFGILLYADGQPAAFSMGERLNEDTFDVHFEKALPGLEGAYPVICRETAKELRLRFPQISLINREEDMGIPGLRKAKEEWFPLYLLDKYTAEFIG